MKTLIQFENSLRDEAIKDGIPSIEYDRIYPRGSFKLDWMEYTERDLRAGYQFKSTLELARYLRTFGRYWKETRRRLQHDFSQSVSAELWSSIVKMEDKGYFTKEKNLC
jgi:hypothetical protein